MGENNYYHEVRLIYQVHVTRMMFLTAKHPRCEITELLNLVLTSINYLPKLNKPSKPINSRQVDICLPS